MVCFSQLQLKGTNIFGPQYTIKLIRCWVSNTSFYQNHSPTLCLYFCKYPTQPSTPTQPNPQSSSTPTQANPQPSTPSNESRYRSSASSLQVVMKEMGGHEARVPRSISIPKIPGIQTGHPRGHGPKQCREKRSSLAKRGKKAANKTRKASWSFSNSDEKLLWV